MSERELEKLKMRAARVARLGGGGGEPQLQPNLASVRTSSTELRARNDELAASNQRLQAQLAAAGLQLAAAAAELTATATCGACSRMAQCWTCSGHLDDDVEARCGETLCYDCFGSTLVATELVPGGRYDQDLRDERGNISKSGKLPCPRFRQAGGYLEYGRQLIMGGGCSNGRIEKAQIEEVRVAAPALCCCCPG